MAVFKATYMILDTNYVPYTSLWGGFFYILVDDVQSPNIILSLVAYQWFVDAGPLVA